MAPGRFDRLLPLAGTLVGLLFIAGLALTWGDPSSEAAPAEHFSWFFLVPLWLIVVGLMLPARVSQAL